MLFFCGGFLSLVAARYFGFETVAGFCAVAFLLFVWKVLRDETREFRI